MTPLIPTLVLSVVSSGFSAFVTLRAVASLNPENRIHLLTVRGGEFTLVVFVWEVFDENLARQSDAEAIESSSSAVRLHLILTPRQKCLFVIMAITLLQIRQAEVSSFDPIHLGFWRPALFLTTVSSAASGIVASAGARGILYVTGTYKCSVAVLNTIVIAFAVKILKAIRRNLSAFSEMDGSWQDVAGEGKVFPSEVVEVLKEGSSWITSDSGSNPDSISSFSFGSTNEARDEEPVANGHSREATRTRNTKILAHRTVGSAPHHDRLVVFGELRYESRTEGHRYTSVNSL
ncbi:hypothetical protein ACEPAF_6558 [Sanghuangporus sanghuang]